MNDNATVLPRQKFHSINVGEIKSNTEEQKRKDFDAKISLKLGDSVSPLKDSIKEQETYEDDTKGKEKAIPEADDFECYDKYISSEVIMLQDGEHLRLYKIISIAKDDTENVISVRNSNPILDNRVYNFMLPYGSLKQYTAENTTENIYSQVDDKRHQYHLIGEIIDHINNGHAVHGDMYVVMIHLLFLGQGEKLHSVILRFGFFV